MALSFFLVSWCYLLIFASAPSLEQQEWNGLARSLLQWQQSHRSLVGARNANSQQLPQTGSLQNFQSRLQKIDPRLQRLGWDPNCDTIEEQLAPDFGSIVYQRRTTRLIHPNDTQLAASYRDYQLEQLNNKKEKNLARKYLFHDEELEDSSIRGCRRNNWRSKSYPVCNLFHEVSRWDSVVERDLVYRGSGHWRDAWEVSPFSGPMNASTPTVLKTIRLHLSGIGGPKILADMAREATIMERLSSSPYIVNIYAFCGTSATVESLPFEVEDEILSPLDRDHVQEYLNSSGSAGQASFNNLTSVHKLQLALDMASSLAVLHGYEGGTIIHGDTHPSQWLRGSALLSFDASNHYHQEQNKKQPRQQLRLNDFNNAIILDWDNKRNEYCREAHKIGGVFHSPEEHLGQRTVDDRSDVYGFGATLYTILTGQYPFWEYSSSEERNLMVRNGTIPALLDDDKRLPSFFGTSKYRSMELYPIEAQLVEIMEECMMFRAENRPDIFQVVTRLQSIQSTS